jgi:hypothetical protein
VHHEVIEVDGIAIGNPKRALGKLEGITNGSSGTFMIAKVSELNIMA